MKTNKNGSKKMIQLQVSSILKWWVEGLNVERLNKMISNRTKAIRKFQFAICAAWTLWEPDGKPPWKWLLLIDYP